MTRSDASAAAFSQRSRRWTWPETSSGPEPPRSRSWKPSWGASPSPQVWRLARAPRVSGA
eukprot:7921170-Pyramimonas_sp.AAC.2